MTALASTDVRRDARARALHLARDHGLAIPDVARTLGVHRSTVWRWCHRPSPRPPGRPRWRPDMAVCRRVLRTIAAAAGRITIRALKRLFPEASRSWLAAVLQRCARRRAARRRARLAKLTWTRAGTVWAMDFTALDGRHGPHAICVRDLAARRILHASVVASESAECTCEVLDGLFAVHGAPLVLKCDNGSAFRSDLVTKQLDRHGVLRLRSPPYTPQYNGACESGIGTLKDVAEDLCATYAPLAGLEDFLDDALEILDQQPIDRRPEAPTRAEVWESRAPCSTGLRARLRARYRRHERKHRRLQGIAPSGPLPDHEQASLDRHAIRDALCELDLLIIQKP